MVGISLGRTALVNKIAQHREIGCKLRRVEAQMRRKYPNLPNVFSLQTTISGGCVHVACFVKSPTELLDLQRDLDEASDVYCTSPLVLKDPRVSRQVLGNLEHLAGQMKQEVAKVATTWLKQVKWFLLEEGLSIRRIFCYEHSLRILPFLDKCRLKVDKGVEFKLVLQGVPNMACPEYEIARGCHMVIEALEKQGEMGGPEIVRLVRDRSTRCRSWRRWQRVLCSSVSQFVGLLWVKRIASELEVTPSGRRVRKGEAVFRATRNARHVVDGWMGEFAPLQQD